MYVLWKGAMKKEMSFRGKGKVDYVAHAEEIARAIASIMKEKRSPFFAFGRS